MLRLILIRHAKSSWDDPLLSDHDRPLNKRGVKSADRIGRWLATQGYLPDEVLCSTATRATQTWEGTSAHLPEPRLQYVGELYHAMPSAMFEVLRHAQGKVVLMIGHNPGIADFAVELVARVPEHPRFVDYPTAATTVIEFETPTWKETKPGRGRALDFVVPRDLA